MYILTHGSIVATWYKFAPVTDPGFGIPTSLLTPHNFVDARDPASRTTVFQSAVEGHVLVKNINNALPLHAPKVLSLFGYDAVAPLQNNWPASGYGKWTNGWESVNANDTDVLTVFTIPQVYQFDPNRPQSALNGTIISGGGSGATTPAYISAPYDAFQQQAYQDGTWLAWDFISQDPVVEAASDACVVMINEFATVSLIERWLPR
jgi:beta-glucosidase